MKKTYFIILLFLLISISFLGGFYIVQKNQKLASAIRNPDTSVNVSDNPKVVNIKPGVQIQLSKPKKLEIPAIKVSALIEEVGLDSQKRMDVPTKFDLVGWYKLGYKVGDKGNAVLDGHFDRKDSSPAVFYNLDKLKIGDDIFVTLEDGNKVSFKVTDKRNFDFDKVPIKELFGPSENAKLNLITCGGAWDAKAKNYSKRLVVYSEMKES